MSEGSPPPPPTGDPSALLLSLLHLRPHRFALLRLSASAFLALRCRRLLSLLLSPALFSLSLSRLRSLPLTSKTSLLARLLLRPLYLLASAHRPLLSPSSPPAGRDLDAAVLLLAMCDSLPEDYPPDTITDDQWRFHIARRISASALSIAGLGREAEFVECIDEAVKCCRLLVAAEGDGGKVGRTAAASPAAVIRLAAAADGGWCAVCLEVTAAEACGMPCGHRFHWGCILPWLRRRNTCPCCRFELPADDVFCEIGRMWRAVVAAGRRPPMG